MAFQVLSDGLLTTNNLSPSITIDANCNKLIVFLYMETYETTASCNLSGTAMTEAAGAATPIVSGFYGKCFAWYIDDPATGSQTVNFTGTTPENRVIACFAQFEDAAAGIEDGVAAAAANASSSTSLSDTLTIANSGCIAYSMCGSGDGGDTLGIASGWTAVDALEDADYSSTSTYSFATATSLNSNETVTWTSPSAVRRHAMSAIAVAPSTGGGLVEATPNSLQLGSTLDSPTYSLNWSSAPNDLQLGVTLDNATGSINWSSIPDAIQLSTTLDNTTGSVSWISTPDSLQLATALDEPTTGSTVSGTPNSLRLGATLDNTSGSIFWQSTPNGLQLGVTLDEVAGSIIWIAAPDSLQIGSTLDNITGVFGTIGSPDSLQLGTDLESPSVSVFYIATPDSLQLSTVLDSTERLTTSNVNKLTVEAVQLYNKNVILGLYEKTSFAEELYYKQTTEE